MTNTRKLWLILPPPASTGVDPLIGFGASAVGMLPSAYIQTQRRSENIGAASKRAPSPSSAPGAYPTMTCSGAT
jgi:hypothetical protein